MQCDIIIKADLITLNEPDNVNSAQNPTSHFARRVSLLLYHALYADSTNRTREKIRELINQMQGTHMQCTSRIIHPRIALASTIARSG